jgi:undecaprenyl-diphosphatase
MDRGPHIAELDGSRSQSKTDDAGTFRPVEMGEGHPDRRPGVDRRALIAILAITAVLLPLLAMLRVTLAFDDVLPEPIMGRGNRIDELVMGALSVIGAGVGLVLIVAPIAGWLWVRRRADGAFLAASVVGALVVSHIVKIVVAAPRPVTFGEEAFGVHGVPELLMGAILISLLLLAFRASWRSRALSVAAMIILIFACIAALEVLIPVRSGFDAFPSGHATGSMAAATALVVLTWRARARIAVLLVAAVLAVGVGVSRVYLGAHYPADVVAGWCIAVASVAVIWHVVGLIEGTRVGTTTPTA